MLTLFQFPTYWGLPNVSPFCLKLETYLRLAGIPYTVKVTTSMGRTPKGKLPFIIDGSETVYDTSLIIQYLKSKYGDPLDKQLTLDQRALGVALQRMLEEHLYFAMTYSRWVDPNYYPAFIGTIFGKLPVFAKLFVPALVRRQVRKQLWQQGTGRHTPEEVYQFGIEDINACGQILGSKTFLFGEKPSSYDVILYAFLEEIIIPPINSPLQSAVNHRPELVAFCTRIRKLAFPNMTQEKDLNYQGA
jgi:glutathione S-transferase